MEKPLHFLQLINVKNSHPLTYLLVNVFLELLMFDLDNCSICDALNSFKISGLIWKSLECTAVKSSGQRVHTMMGIDGSCL